MLRLLEDLPVELVGTNVLGYLSVKDIVMLERACGSKKSHQAFMEQIPHRPAVVLLSWKHDSISVLTWFANRQCKIGTLNIQYPGGNPCLHITNLQVDYFDLQINSTITIDILTHLQESNIGCGIRSINIYGNENMQDMEKLSACTGNVKQLTIRNSNNCMDCLSADILSRWKLKEINIRSSKLSKSLVLLIVQTCTELTGINLHSNTVDNAAVIAIAQHCPKLETLLLRSSTITWTSLLALSERGLPLKELDISSIPNIPTADIARRCSHALSRIRHLITFYLHQNGQDVNILLPYMTGLTILYLSFYKEAYLPLLTQHCHKLTKIAVFNNSYSGSDILLLCRTNPLLQDFYEDYRLDITNTTLVELIHACPHLHTLDLPCETDITDIGILALSEHCPQLQVLLIYKYHKVTETAVLHLLQRCRKLTSLWISSSSLSEETWTQLDHNTKKGVSRWW